MVSYLLINLVLQHNVFVRYTFIAFTNQKVNTNKSNQTFITS